MSFEGITDLATLIPAFFDEMPIYIRWEEAYSGEWILMRDDGAIISVTPVPCAQGQPRYHGVLERKAPSPDPHPEPDDVTVESLSEVVSCLYRFGNEQQRPNPLYAYIREFEKAHKG